MKKESVVVRLRPMGEMLKKTDRQPVIVGRSPRDFAQTRRDELERIRAEIQRASRDNARAGAWAFVSGMAWAAFIVVAFYQLTGGVA